MIGWRRIWTYGLYYQAIVRHGGQRLSHNTSRRSRSRSREICRFEKRSVRWDPINLRPLRCTSTTAAAPSVGGQTTAQTDSTRTRPTECVTAPSGDDRGRQIAVPVPASDRRVVGSSE